MNGSSSRYPKTRAPMTTEMTEPEIYFAYGSNLRRISGMAAAAAG